MISKGQLATNNRFFTLRRLPDPQLTEEWERILTSAEFKARLLRYLRLLVLLGKGNASSVGLALRRALLLYGPPGCGKTSLARSLPNEWATLEEVQANFLQAHANALPSGERGGTQKNVETLFLQIGEVAAMGLPTFVLFDEVEAVSTDRASTAPRPTRWTPSTGSTPSSRRRTLCCAPIPMWCCSTRPTCPAPLTAPFPSAWTSACPSHFRMRPPGCSSCGMRCGSCTPAVWRTSVPGTMSRLLRKLFASRKACRPVNCAIPSFPPSPTRTFPQRLPLAPAAGGD